MGPKPIPFDAPLRSNCHRRPERQRHAEKSPTFPRDDDMGFHEFRRQLAYKTQMRGNRVNVADRWFASSKRCCRCNKINATLTLSDRIFKCAGCGLEMDRDLNAANNLYNTVSSTGFQACGEQGAGPKVTLSETGLSEAGTKPCTDLYIF